MPKRTEWTIRVINYPMDVHVPALPGIWVEQLRYMGHAYELAVLENPTRTVIEFRAPLPAVKVDGGRRWCESNASRMRSFGIEAAIAPVWNIERNTVDADREAAQLTAHNRLLGQGMRRS